MEKVLVTFLADWGDEFDVSGFCVYEKEIWERNCARFKAAKRYTSFYFGSNEGFEDIDEDWLDNYEVQDITEQEYEVISKLFGGGYGDFPDPLRVVGDLTDEEEKIYDDYMY